MLLTRTVESQARIRIPLKVMQNNLNPKLLGTDFTFLAAPLPNFVLLLAEGHEKFDQLKKLKDGTGDDESGEEADRWLGSLTADSIWPVTAAYEPKEARHALSLGMMAVHLGLIPAIGKKAAVRLLAHSVEIWHLANWVETVTKANAQAMGYPSE